MQLSFSVVAACSVVLALGPGYAIAQDFKPYPGAKLEEKYSKQASRSGMTCQVFVSNDSFEKVYAFYKGAYREHTWPVSPPKLPTGREIQWAYFLLDGAKDLAHSKYWLKIQRPFIGTVNDELDFKDIRELSLIQVVRRQ